ncbi:MAG: phosphoribosylglycinamide formyltransferase [Pseudomonadota bacterium]
MTRVRLGILISGRGSNMEAILQASAARDYPAEPVLVLTNRPGAAGLAIAETFGVATDHVDHRQFGEDREAFERELNTRLSAANIDLIALAGFMRVLTPWFVRKWHGRLINIHPSLLPKYPGLHTHKRVLEAGDPTHGCSVHWVTEGVDEGAVIDQSALDVAPDDTPETLAKRVLTLEHDLYPRALKLACAEIKR